jgi:hypothetical protein
LDFFRAGCETDPTDYLPTGEFLHFREITATGSIERCHPATEQSSLACALGENGDFRTGRQTRNK